MPETGRTQFHDTHRQRQIDSASVPRPAATRIASTSFSAAPRRTDADIVPVHRAASSLAPGGRETTFLTKAAHRAPSAYYIDAQDQVQRARQEHAHGASISLPQARVQAFTEKLQLARSVTRNTRRTASSDDATTTFSPDQALRMEILDGLASPRAAAGNAHVEAHCGPVTDGNPHISGGSVAFAAPGSPLADFEYVLTMTRRNQASRFSANWDSAPTYVTETIASEPGRAARKFNRRAMKQQQRFAKAVLTSTR